MIEFLDEPHSRCLAMAMEEKGVEYRKTWFRYDEFGDLCYRDTVREPPLQTPAFSICEAEKCIFHWLKNAPSYAGVKFIHRHGMYPEWHDHAGEEYHDYCMLGLYRSELNDDQLPANPGTQNAALQALIDEVMPDNRAVAESATTERED